MTKTHLIDIRLHNNAGMRFPVCRRNDRLLDLDCGRWPLTGKWAEVTCQHCRRRARKYYAWAYGRKS